MSPAGLGQVGVAALGIAISPVAVAAVIILLLSPRPKATSIGFLIGWILGIVVAVTACAVLSTLVPSRVPGPAQSVLAVMQLVIGAVLLVLAAVQWRARRVRDDRPATPPRWIQAIDRATPPLAVAVGCVMALNPPNLLLSAAGGVAIGTAGLVAWEIGLVITVFVFVAASSVLVPVVVYLIAADGLREPLEMFRRWLTRHSTVLLTGVLAAVGLLAAGQGLSSLW